MNSFLWGGECELENPGNAEAMAMCRMVPLNQNVFSASINAPFQEGSASRSTLVASGWGWRNFYPFRKAPPYGVKMGFIVLPCVRLASA